ncbi:hypothetical protein ACIBQX_49930 [Nonomuraea sp. NPDC049714]
MRDDDHVRVEAHACPLAKISTRAATRPELDKAVSLVEQLRAAGIGRRRC